MRRAFFIFGIVLAGSMGLALTASTASAWYDHEEVMKWILPRVEREAPLPASAWDKPLPKRSPGFKAKAEEITGLLLVRRAELKSDAATTYRDLFRLSAEDPDHGMDQELADSADPTNDRKYMGGTHGTTSQGFRHMYWAGWDWRRPIASFQIPFRPLGQAPDRIELLANETRNLIRNGDWFWAIRVLGWTAHYLQDLNQPYHAVQIPSLRMIPWSALFAWPPHRGYENLIRESTRTLTNYHWAYEGYVRYALGLGERSPFKRCFEESAGSLLVSSPKELALLLAKKSAERASSLGEASVRFFGLRLKDPGVSIPESPETLFMQDLLENPAYAETRERLHALTCESLRASADATVWITRWAFSAAQ